ncbi:MAG: VIT family protein [Methanoregula sp. PtaU1.Bin051]|nr:MAG: VIT family protein [Methanoregula sp. PtaU1.Bin051]
MNESIPSGKIRDFLLTLQKDEITEHEIYAKIAAGTRDHHNRQVLEDIAVQEYEHYLIWKKYTGKDVDPDALRIWYYYSLTRIFGITFAVKLMEGIEKRAQKTYRDIGKVVPEMNEILSREESHEKQLIGLLNEERLRYLGSVVLGLNDALVEFTGSLAGFTFALQNTRIIAMAGLIMGIAASLSMAASEYLSQRSEAGNEVTNPAKASAYTGVAYIFTVILLVLPFLLLENSYSALILTLAAAVVVIFIFTFYISVAKDLSFRQRFIEMATISLGIAAISFAIGMVIRIFLGVSG